MCKCKLYPAHVHSWCNDELIEEFRFKNVLRELIGKTLQLSLAPNLDMSYIAYKLSSNPTSMSLTPPLANKR